METRVNRDTDSDGLFVVYVPEYKIPKTNTWQPFTVVVKNSKTLRFENCRQEFVNSKDAWEFLNKLNLTEQKGSVVDDTFDEIDKKFNNLSEESISWIKQKILWHISEAYERGKKDKYFKTW